MTIFYKAIYNDGTSFAFSEDSVGTDDYKKIDRIKLVSFEVYRDTFLLHTLFLEPGQQLIVRRRVRERWGKRKNPNWKQGDDPAFQMIGFSEQLVFYMVGYHENIKGENKQSILLIYQDGHTEMISKWKEEPYSKPQFQEQELTNDCS